MLWIKDPNIYPFSVQVKDTGYDIYNDDVLMVSDLKRIEDVKEFLQRNSVLYHSEGIRAQYTLEEFQLNLGISLKPSYCPLPFTTYD